MQSIAGIARQRRSPAEARRRRPSNPPEAADAHRVRVPRALVGAIVFAVAVASFTRVPLLPDVGADLSLSAGDLGLLIAAFGLGRLLTDLPAGRVASSVSPRRGVAVASVGRLPIGRRDSPSPASSVGRIPDAGTSGGDHRLERDRSSGPEAVGAPSRWELAAIATAPFTVFFVIGGVMQTLVPLIGGHELGLSASTIGLALALGGAMRFPAAWVAGLGSDRYSRREVLVPAL